MEHKENQIEQSKFFNVEGVQLKMVERQFPFGPVVKNPPSNAGDLALVSGHGTKIPHATTSEHACSVSPCTREALRECLHCTATGEASTMQQRPQTAKKCSE